MYMKKISALFLAAVITVGVCLSAGADEYYNIAYCSEKSAAVTVKGCLGAAAADKDVKVRIKRNGALVASAESKTDYRGCYETVIDFKSDISSCEVTTEYDSIAVPADIKRSAVSEMDIHAYITPEGIVCVEGFLSAKTAGDTVNILLADKFSAGREMYNPAAGAHIGSCRIDETGHFIYKFTFGGGDISNYRLLLSTKDISPAEIEISETVSAAPTISLGIKNEHGERAANYTAVRAIVDSRLSGAAKADLFAAYYDENERLIGVNSKVNYDFDFSDCGVVNVFDLLTDIPKDAEKVRLMAWKGQGFEPLGSAGGYPSAKKKYFYVAENGSDFNDGSYESPLATLNGAKRAVREYKEVNGMPENGITVRFAAGTYPLTDTVEFTAVDSGTESAAITYEAYNGAEVIFDGGVHIPPSAFKAMEETSISNRIPSDARANVYCVDLKNYGIYDFAKEYEKGYLGSEMPGAEVFSAGNPMITARYPNVNSGGEQQYLLTASVSQEDGLSIGYTDEAFENAVNFDGAMVEGWLENGYEYRAAAIDGVDKDNNIVKLKRSGRFRAGARYFINNLPELLDAPGEYYIDRGTGILYLIPSGSISEADITISVFGKNISDAAIKTNRASYINFKGFTITDCRAGGIYIYGGNSIKVDSCKIKNLGYTGVIVGAEQSTNKHATVNGANVYNPISFNNSDYVKGVNHSITNSEIYNTGESAVELCGGDRIKLEGSNLSVGNCIMHDCGRIVKSAPTVAAVGVGITISNNDIYNAACAGIVIGGNEIIVEKNEFWNCSSETEDYGTIYSCPYTGAEIQAGSVIRYNYFHDVPKTVRNIAEDGGNLPKPHRPAVYNDYGDSFLDVHHNYFENVPIGCFNASGAENNWTDNVFLNVDIPMLIQWNNLIYSSTDKGNAPQKLFDSISLREYKIIGIESGVWKEKYPKVAEVKKRMTALKNVTEVTYPYSDVKNNIAFFLSDAARVSLNVLCDESSYLDKITSLRHFKNEEQNKFLRERGLETNLYTDAETDTQNPVYALSAKGIELSKIGRNSLKP